MEPLSVETEVTVAFPEMISLFQLVLGSLIMCSHSILCFSQHLKLQVVISEGILLACDYPQRFQVPGGSGIVFLSLCLADHKRSGTW